VRTVLLGVDDMLFVRPSVPWTALLSALERPSKSVLHVALALHPRINYCHPANKPVRPPMIFFNEGEGATMGATEATVTAAASAAAPCSKSQQLTSEEAAALPSSVDSPLLLLRFLRALGSADFNYPFSLAGGLYRTADVWTLLQQSELLFGRAAFAHPNKMEIVGNSVASQGGRAKGARVAGAPASASTSSLPSASSNGGIAADNPPQSTMVADDWRTKPSRIVPLAARYPYSVCLSAPVLSVVTINRVQDVCANPVYKRNDAAAAVAGGGSGVAEGAYEATAAAAAEIEQTSVTSSAPADVGAELSADELLRMWEANPALSFDLPRYYDAAATGRFRAVHIGDFFTRR